ncbi:hypothetical protein ES706_06125 [subsurface metagenome]
MRLTEQIQMKKRWDLSCLCYFSKNLYNLANYYIRQELFYLGNWLRYYDLWYMLKDKEPIKKHKKYAGKRINRGLFKSKKGILINADVNAGYNIIKKVVPNAISADGIEGVGLHPYSIAI